MHHEERSVRRIVARLTRLHEADQPKPWKMGDAPADFMAEQLRHIVGIEIRIARIDGKRKLNQHHRQPARADGALTVRAAAIANSTRGQCLTAMKLPTVMAMTAGLGSSLRAGLQPHAEAHNELRARIGRCWLLLDMQDTTMRPDSCAATTATHLNLPRRFARRVFFWTGIYGTAALLPLYFLEDYLGRQFPPSFSRPEQLYGFLGVALAWQLAFLLIARDVERYRLFMLPASAEKLLSSIAVLVLYAHGRVAGPTVAPAVIDLLLGCMFLVAYIRCTLATTRAGPPHHLNDLPRATGGGGQRDLHPLEAP